MFVFGLNRCDFSEILGTGENNKIPVTGEIIGQNQQTVMVVCTPYTVQHANDKMAAPGHTVFPHPPYSPDLAPSDFRLFGPLKKIFTAISLRN